MRYGILALLLLLAAVSGCNKKTTIDPSRYGRGPAVEQPNSSFSDASAVPAAQQDSLGEKDLQPAPQVAETPHTDSSLPTPKLAPPVQQAPAVQPSQPAPPREMVIYQVGVFSDIANATAMKNKLDKAGFETSIERDVSLPQPVYRVTAKWYGSDPEGRARLQDAGVMDAIVLGGSKRPGGSAPAPAPNYSDAAPAPAAGGSLLCYQVGVFSDPINAARMRDKLDAQGIRVDTPEEAVDGRTYYKVIAMLPGPKEDAQGRLAMLGFPDPIFLPSASAGMAAPAAAQAAVPAAAPGGTVSFQVGSFTDVANAEALRNRLNGAGITSEIELIALDGGNRYRVVATGTGSPSDVEATLRQMGVQNPLLLHR